MSKNIESRRSGKSPQAVVKPTLPAPDFFDDIPEKYINPHDLADPSGKKAELHGLAEWLAKMPASEKGQRQQVLVVGSGGTFQSRKGPKGYEPVPGILKETVEEMPIDKQLRSQFACHVFELFAKDSSQMNVWHWKMLAQTIAYLEQTNPGTVDAVIAPHGTDTMDDAGCNLSLLLATIKKLIILTGSQQALDAEGGDAPRNWTRCLQAILLAAGDTRHITETIILCGPTAVRATQAEKVSDHEDAYSHFRGSEHSLVDFSRDTNFRNLRFADQTRVAMPGRPFSGYRGEGMKEYPDVAEISMRGQSPEQFEQTLRAAETAAITLMGSATAPDKLSEITAQFYAAGKPMVLMSPFPDSQLEIGHYAAGRGLARVQIPYFSGTQSAVRAKMNYVMGRFGIRSEMRDEKTGPTVTPYQRDIIADQMGLDYAGEFTVR